MLRCKEATPLYSEQLLSMTTVYLSIDLDYPNKGPIVLFHARVLPRQTVVVSLNNASNCLVLRNRHASRRYGLISEILNR